MKNNQFKFGFYTMNNKNRSNYIKYHEPTKLYPSNSGKININLNSYRHNTNLSNNNHYMRKKKENSNNFNINHSTKRNIINSHSRPENVNLAQMLNNLKREIVEISNNIKETDSKVEYYMNKNLENSKKMRSNSANISKNIILLPRHKCSLSNRGISLDVINSNYSKSSNYIRNDMPRDIPTTDYISSINTNANTSNNTRLTYNLYSRKNNNNNNINRLTIQVTNNNPLHKIGCLNTNFNKKKLYNNYINDIRPKYHTAENFYHRDKKKRPKEKEKDIYNISKHSNTNSSINNEYNCNNNNISNANNLPNNISNKISEKSSIYINTNYQDYINDSIKKIPKSSASYRNNMPDKNTNKIIKNDAKNKIGKFNYKRGSLEKHILDLQDNITSSNNIMPGLFSSANDIKKELEALKIENEDLKMKYEILNNDMKKDKRLLQLENKNKDEKISNLNKEIQRLNNTINIKDSIINILKYGNNNNYKIKQNNENYNNNISNNSSINEVYSANNLNNINSGNNSVSNIILNNNIKNLQNEISKLRYNLNLQRSDEYLNLQNKNKELIQENMSLKEQIKNLIDKCYNNKQTKLESEINIKDKKLNLLMNDIANYDKNQKIMEEEIKKLKLENDKKNLELSNINKYMNENKLLKNEIQNIENKYKKMINELNQEIENMKMKNNNDEKCKC